MGKQAKISKIIKNSTIFLVIAMILLNSVITMPVYGAVKEIPADYQKKVDELKKIIEDPNIKGQLTNDGEIVEFIYLYEQTKGRIVANKKDRYTELAQEYVDRYKPFKEKNPQDFNEKMEKMWKVGVTDEFKDYIEEVRKKYNAYLKEIGYVDENEAMKSEQEIRDAQTEEYKRVADLLRKTRDNGGLLVGPLFEAVARLAIALADSVLNVMQKYMIPGSPTAIKERYKDVKDILNTRSEDDYYIFFYELKYEPTFFGQISKLWGGKAEKDEPMDIPSVYVTSTEPVPFIYYTPLAIFSNKLPIFDVNFIDTNTQLKSPYSDFKDQQMDFLEKTEFISQEADYKFSRQTKDVNDAQERLEEAVAPENEAKNNPAKTIQGTVAKWYVALRNLTATGLLVVLVYIGIRILTSITGEEEAKYKVMLKDWLMGLVILFFIHYLMAGLLAITNAMTNLATVSIDFHDTSTGGDTLFNELRTQIVLYSKREDLVMMAGYGMLYITAIWYTIRFTWKFLKRVIYMAFLTLVAPVTALTYPLDKMKDGKAQAFDLWWREYTFNLILQPIDLLVYVVIFTSAMELIKTNPIYGVVTIGFVAQAENIIKKMFGLEPRIDNGNGAFASGAVFGSAMSALRTGASQVSNIIGGDEEQPQDEEGSSKVRMVDDGRQADKDAPKDLSEFKNGDSGKVRVGNMFMNVGTGTTTTGSSTSRKRMNNAPPYGSTSTLGPKPKIKNKPMTIGQEIMNSSVARGLGRVRARYLNKNTAKKAAKLATMGLGAGVFGTIGIGAGLASDDYTNVFKMGAAGAAGGVILGREISKQAGALVKEGKSIKEAYQKGYYGDEYEEKILNPKLDKEWYNSEDTKRALIAKYGDEWKEKREEALELRKQGITDQDDIEKAIRLKDEKGFSIKEAGNIINFANRVTSRSEILQEGGEEKIYQQVLNLVGNEEGAKRAMAGIKETLNLGNEYKTSIREQPKHREITPEMVDREITREEHMKDLEKQVLEQKEESIRVQDKQVEEINEKYNRGETGKPEIKTREHEIPHNVEDETSGDSSKNTGDKKDSGSTGNKE